MGLEGESRTVLDSGERKPKLAFDTPVPLTGVGLHTDSTGSAIWEKVRDKYYEVTWAGNQKYEPEIFETVRIGSEIPQPKNFGSSMYQLYDNSAAAGE